MKKWSQLSILFVLLLFFITSCADTSAELMMEVYGQKLSTASVITEIKQLDAYNPNENLYQNELVDLINTHITPYLLFQAAGYYYELDKTEEIQEKVRLAKPEVLVERDSILFNFLIPKSKPISQAELQALHLENVYYYKIQRIVFTKKSIADSIYATLIANNASFLAMLEKFSFDRSGLAAAETLPFFKRFELPKNIHEVLPQLEKFEISKPIFVNGNYEIFRWIEQRAIVTTDFDEAVDSLSLLINTEIKRQFMTNYLADLQDKHVKINDVLATHLLTAFSTTPNFNLKDTQLKNVLSDTIVTFFNTSKTVADVSNYYENLPKEKRPPLNFLSDVRLLIHNYVKSDLLFADAIQRNLDNSDAYKAKMQVRLDKWVTDAYMKKYVLKDISISDEDIKGYYGEFFDRYKNIEKEKAYEQISVILYEAESQKAIRKAARELNDLFITRINSRALYQALQTLNNQE